MAQPVYIVNGPSLWEPVLKFAIYAVGIIAAIKLAIIAAMIAAGGILAAYAIAWLIKMAGQ